MHHTLEAMDKAMSDLESAGLAAGYLEVDVVDAFRNNGCWICAIYTSEQAAITTWNAIKDACAEDVGAKMTIGNRIRFCQYIRQHILPLHSNGGSSSIAAPSSPTTKKKPLVRRYVPKKTCCRTLQVLSIITCCRSYHSSRSSRSS